MNKQHINIQIFSCVLSEHTFIRVGFIVVIQAFLASRCLWIIRKKAMSLCNHAVFWLWVAGAFALLVSVVIDWLCYNYLHAERLFSNSVLAFCCCCQINSVLFCLFLFVVLQIVSVRILDVFLRTIIRFYFFLFLLCYMNVVGVFLCDLRYFVVWVYITLLYFQAKTNGMCMEGMSQF